MLSTTHDFFSTEDSLRLLSKRTGATVRRVTLYDNPWQATVDEMTSRLAGRPRPATKVVAVTWVHSSTGVRLPVQEIASALRALEQATGQRVLLCVDGVHGFAAVDVDLPDLGCDFLSAGTHKWLFGPRGTGILWGRDWGPLTELIPSFSGPDEGARLSPGGYHAFEHRWALDQGFAFHQRWAARRPSSAPSSRPRSSRRAWPDGAGRPRGDAGGPGGLGRDRVPRRRGPAAGQRRVRAASSRASWRARRRTQKSYLRLGPSIVTTPEQVDAAVEAVAGLV